MAINNGRYVVTGGYMDPNGNIIEETQWAPSKTYSPDHILGQVNSLLSGEKTPEQIRYEDKISSVGSNTSATGNNKSTYAFSPAETFQLRSDGYYNQGNTVLGDAWKSLADGLKQYNSEANSTLAGYNSLLSFIKDNEAPIQSAAGKLYNELTSGIQKDYDYVNRMFGPNGELTEEVNKYYDDLGNYLATDAGYQDARIAAQGVHSGASLGAIRAQQNEAYNQSFERYVKAKEQQINAKQAIASNLINFMSTLRKEYGDTTNKYIIEMYKRASDLYEKTAMSALADINAFNAVSGKSGSGGSSNSNTNSYLDTALNRMATKQYLMQNGMTEEQAEAWLKKNFDGTQDDSKIIGSEADGEKDADGKKEAEDKLGLELDESAKKSSIGTDITKVGMDYLNFPYALHNPLGWAGTTTKDLINLGNKIFGNG